MYCQSCGLELDPTDRFCPACGSAPGGGERIGGARRPAGDPPGPSGWGGEVGAESSRRDPRATPAGPAARGPAAPRQGWRPPEPQEAEDPFWGEDPERPLPRPGRRSAPSPSGWGGDFDRHGRRSWPDRDAGAPRRGIGLPGGRGRRIGRPLAAIVLLGLIVWIGTSALSRERGPDGPTPSSASGDPARSGEPRALAPLTGEAVRGERVELGRLEVRPKTEAILRGEDGSQNEGIWIGVGAEAFTEETSLHVVSRSLRISGYRGLVTPLGPLIEIDLGGALPRSPIEVHFPITVPPDWAVSGFWIDAEGRLEPVPVKRSNALEVSLAIRRGGSLFVAGTAAGGLGGRIGSAFEPGRDDVVSGAPGGHGGGGLAGAAVAATWYANRADLGGTPLRELLDNRGSPTPDFWPDDAGYRLAALVERDLGWPGLAGRIAAAYPPPPAGLTWDAVRYGLLASARPALLMATASGERRLLVVYGADESGLLIADPAAPGEERRLEWDPAEQAFAPYRDPLDPDRRFERFTYLGVSSLLRWSAVAARFAELAEGHLGEGVFPEPTLTLRRDGRESPLRDAEVGSGQVTIGVSGPADGPALRATFYLGTSPLAGIETPGRIVLELDGGENDLGVFIEAADPTGTWSPVGFERYRIVAPGEARRSPRPSARLDAGPSPSPSPSKAAASATPRASSSRSPFTFMDCAHPPTVRIELTVWTWLCGPGGPLAPKGSPTP